MSYIDELGAAAKKAEREMIKAGTLQKNAALRAIAEKLLANKELIIKENARDIENAKINGMSEAMIDRLTLTEQRIEGMAEGVTQIISLKDPIGEVVGGEELLNGLKIVKKRVPLGVIGIIYDARPNVSFDVFSLCLKSGNACILKGGSDADCSNRAIVGVIHKVLKQFGVNTKIVELLPPDREATAQLLTANGFVDLIIPRGSSNLINFVRQNATVPVIETGAGICHTYFDAQGDLQKGAAIINNAKTRRVSVCNALDCLLINENRLSALPVLCQKLAESNVVIYADKPAFVALKGNYPDVLLQEAMPEDFGREFLDYKMSIKCVSDVAEAVKHINAFGSKHSECIVTDDATTADYFCRMVDAACVYHNAPTSFTDGAQFGLGAEIGISTQKLHARGPMALAEITTYKWLIEGEGQVRS